MKYWLLHLLMFVTMSRVCDELNVPPLQHKIVLAVRKTRTEKRDMELHHHELDCIKWEHGTTAHSRNWGKTLRDLIILTKQLRTCVTIPK